ncbi:MAG: hypothetical protein ACI9XO_004575 [Paraglaciecola sp.]|jgi:hypothetical protein
MPFTKFYRFLFIKILQKDLSLQKESGMLRGKLLAFITDYIEMLSKSLAEYDASYRLIEIQQCWLDFCLAGIIMTNSVYWGKVLEGWFW